MRKVVFVLGTPERRAVKRNETLTDFVYDALNKIAVKHDLDASIVFAVTDAWFASSNKTEIGMDRIRAERPRVIEEINASGAELLIMFGPVAAASVMNHGSLTEDFLQRRAHYPLALSGAPDFPGDKNNEGQTMWSPAAYYTSSIEQIRMAPGMLEWWDLDIEAALKGYSEPVVEPFELNNDWRFVPQLDDPQVGFDIETTGLDPWASNAAIRMVQVSGRTHGVMWTRVWDWDKVPVGVLDMLKDPGIVKVGANIAFDVKWCDRFGVTVNNYVDLLTTEHVLYPGNPRLTLKDLGFKYFPQVGNYHRAVYAMAEKFNDDWSLIPAEDMYEYAAADAQVSLVAFEHQRRAIQDGGVATQYAANLLWDLYPLLAQMSSNGARVDTDVNAELATRYSEQMTVLRAQITEVLGPINLGSTEQLARALKEAVPTIDLTTGRIKRALDDDGVIKGRRSSAGFAEENEEVSTDRATLERESHKHPVLKLIIDYRKLGKRYDNYVVKLAEKFTKHTGGVFIHPDFRSDVTATYRLSSRNPNGQNMPRNEKDTVMSIKRQFVSRFKDGLIVEADMSQIELRVAAWFTGDHKLRSALAGDVHREMAAAWMSKPVDQVTDDERQDHKPPNFAIVYGGGAKRVSELLHIPMKRAQTLIKQFYAHYSQLDAGIKAVHAGVQRSLQVSTPFGFRRQFFPPDNWRSSDGFQIYRESWNTIIQNTAAALMYCAMIRFDELWKDQEQDTSSHAEGILKSVPILQIHDSYVIDTHPDEFQIVARLLRQAFLEAPTVAQRYGVEFDMPLDVDIKAGSNWAETKKLAKEYA